MSHFQKRAIEDLAFFGGPKTFSETLHVGRPNIPEFEKFSKLAKEVFERRWLTNDGPLVRELEQKLAQRFKVKNCIAVCNATVGLDIAIRGLKLSGEVIVPSFTFIATAHSLLFNNIKPVFCDIDPKTHQIDVKKIEALITSKTTAIMAVNLWGKAAPIEELQAIADKHSLQLVFDSAHAFDCSYKGRKLGGFGRWEVMSFHATKYFNTFEGGAIFTNDDALAHDIRLLRNFGFAKVDQVIALGTNAKMSEISAAMGLASLGSIGEVLAHNKKNYQTYADGLNGLEELKLMSYDAQEENNYSYIVTEVNESRCQLSRDEIVDILWAENIWVRRYFYPGCHNMEPYRTLYPGVSERLPATEALNKRVMCFPTGTAVSIEVIQKITAVLKFIFQKSSEISKRLHPTQTPSSRITEVVTSAGQA